MPSQPAPSRPQRAMGLPSMTALVAFEAAARRESFKLAAADLNVTPAAVSQQVKALELELGILLFHRQPRGVTLTESGVHLFGAVRKGFDGIAQTIAHLRESSQIEDVSIQLTTAVSSFWLTPRLTRFWREHGDISVAQTVTDMRQAGHACDLKLYYGGPSDEPGEVRLLFNDTISVLASPEFIAHHGPVSLDALPRLPVIHMNAEDPRWIGWRQWGQLAGYAGGFGPRHQVNNYAIATQVAKDGLGLFLGWETLLRGELDSGRLVRALELRIAAPDAFYLALRNEASEKARVFRDWLLDENIPGDTANVPAEQRADERPVRP